MRCQRCEFENMPGLVTCMRCGSALTVPTESIDVHPPRMSHWKRPIRKLFRGFRRFIPASAWSGEDLHTRAFPDWLRKASKVAFFGAVLSFVPGVAHLIQGRFREIRWWVVGWFVLLLGALFFFGSGLGMLLMGLALGVHVWIAVHSALLQEYQQFNYRLMGYLIILVFYFMFYRLLTPIVFFDLQGGYSAVNVPYARVEHGDFLIGRPSQTDPDDITRGSFVLVQLENVANHGFRRQTNTGYAQVIGLAGETVAIENDRFVVDDQPLDAEQYPLPTWLKRQTFSTIVPQDSYFISAQYSGRGYNEAQAIEVCVVNRSQIEAKAFLRWNPLQRRGFIQETE